MEKSGLNQYFKLLARISNFSLMWFGLALYVYIHMCEFEFVGGK